MSDQEHDKSCGNDSATVLRPKVFVSHSTKDKERFVNKFVERLRDHGADVWFDKSEMLPGHTLPKKITDAIYDCDVVIFIISDNAIASPWVEEELQIAHIRKVESGIKVIPVTIDRCEVPNQLKHAVRVEIDDLSNYEQALDHILGQIFNRKEQSRLGQSPQWYLNTAQSNFLA
jgi:hypothetical protein